jgi:uncharacterized protein YndB with AHSA1/START domain
VVTVEDVGAMVEGTVLLAGCTAERALSAFTDPVLVAAWWGGGTLTASLVAGGAYTVEFAALGATMTGQVVHYEPGGSLEFSWGWAHEPQAPRRTVSVTADGDAPAALTVRHGPYGDGEAEHAARAEHRAGWEYFLPRLATVLNG